MNVLWRVLPGHSRYEVSSLGAVRIIGSKRVLAQSLNPGTGYMTVHIERVTTNIHSLVARVFIGKAPKGKEVNHKDTDKTNNTESNLEYLTRGDNMIHRYKSGPSKSCRLDERKVREIRRLRSTLSLQSLADRFGVAKGTIVFITTGKTWRWV